MPSIHQELLKGTQSFERVSPKRSYIGIAILWLIGLIFVISAIIFPIHRIQSIKRIYDFQSAEMIQRNIQKTLPLAIITGIISGGFGIWLIVLGIFTIRHSRKTQGLHIEITHNGLTQTTATSSTFIHWNTIETVHYVVILPKVSGVRMPASHIYTITCEDGQEYQFDNTIKNIYMLGETIQKQVSKRQLPATLAALKRGETIAFGPFSVTQTGLTTKHGSVAWNEIVELSVYRGWVTVQRSRPRRPQTFASVRLQKIPNLGLFLALARHYETHVEVTVP